MYTKPTVTDKAALFWFCSFSDGQITAILDQKNYVEELNRHLRFRTSTSPHFSSRSPLVTNQMFLIAAHRSITSRPKWTLWKSPTQSWRKRWEDCARRLASPHGVFSFTGIVFLSLQLAVANNRIITLQEDVERVKEESSYQLESRKVSPSIIWRLGPRRGFQSYCVFWMLLSQAVRSDSASDGQALGETRKQLKEETLLRLVRFRPLFSAKVNFQHAEFIYRCRSACVLNTQKYFATVTIFNCCRMWRRSWRCRLGWNRRWRCPWRCWRRTYVRSRTPWWSSGSSLRTSAPLTNSYSTGRRWACYTTELLEKWLLV